jgi:hypothetical protein
MTVVLGLGTEEDAGAALVIDGRIVAAVNEERLCRLKMAMGFPHQSVREVLRLAGLGMGEVDAVLVGGTREIFIPGLSAFDGWFQYSPVYSVCINICDIRNLMDKHVEFEYGTSFGLHYDRKK